MNNTLIKCRKKKVSFVEQPVVHNLYHWSYAYRAARKGEWMNHAVDRCRFARRISSLDSILAKVNIAKHRQFKEEEKSYNKYFNE